MIVVDGGSRDGTDAIAARLGARVVTSARGRGAQLDAGARAATGDALLFLHADTDPPPDFACEIARALGDPRIVLGAFRLEFAAREARYRLLERATRLRIALTGTPYGDQGLFCRGEDYRRSGGFPPWPLLEDVALVRRLRGLRTSTGAPGRVVVLRAPVRTSARRYRTAGFWRALLRNRTASLLWMLRVPPGVILRVLRVPPVIRPDD